MRTRLLVWPALAALAAGCGRIDYDLQGDGGPPGASPDATSAPPDARLPDTKPPDAGPPDAFAGDPAELWWDDAWGHRIELALDTSVAGEKLVDVPVPIFLDDGRIDISKVNPDGSDIRVVAGDNRTELAHELEIWAPGGDPNAGSAMLWVKVPVFDPDDARSRIWVYFDNPDAEHAQRPAEVWSAGYTGVWHLSEDTGAARADSSVKANELVAGGDIPSTFGVLAGAADLSDEPATSLVGLPLARPDEQQDGLEPSTELTIEAWINPVSSGSSMLIAGKANDGLTQGYALKRLGGETIELLLSFDCVSMETLVGSELADTGRWHHIAAVYDGQAMRIFLNGILDAELFPQTGGAVCDGGDPFIVGALASGGAPLDSLLDEVRVAKVARSAAWIRSQYKAMIDGVVGYGPMEARP